MGCGASSIYAKDGTIPAGKGEAGFNVSKTNVTNAYIWAGEDSDKVQLQLKDIPADPKLLKEAKFVDKGSVGNMVPLVLTAPAGLRQSRWMHTIDGGDVAKKYPSFCDLKLPQTIHKAHKADEKKHVENLNKGGKQKDKEGHPYVKDAEKALKDIEACERFVNPSQMDADMNIYKESLTTVEETVVQNAANTFASVTTAIGFFKEKDGEVVMGIPDKALKAVEDKKNCDGPMQENLLKAVDGKNKATTAVYKGTVTGAAKALALEPEQLVPGLDGLIAASIGCKPFCEPYDKFATFTDKGITLPTPEERPEIEKVLCQALLDSDKANEDAIRKKEQTAEFVKEFEEKVKAQMEFAVAACKPLAEADIAKGKRVMARWCAEGQLFGYQEGVVDSAVTTGVWYENAEAKPEPIKKEGKIATIKFDDGTEAHVPIESISAEKTDAAKEDDLIPGTLVRAKFLGDCFLDGVVAGPKNKDGYPVTFDPVFTNNVKIEDIRPAHDVDKIASFPHTLYRQANDVEVQWLEGNASSKVEVNIWREGADDQVETTELKAVKNKKKDDKGAETSEECAGGYKATVSLLQGRLYRYNFKVTPDGGEAAYFVDFGKGCEQSGSKGFKYTVTAG